MTHVIAQAVLGCMILGALVTGTARAQSDGQSDGQGDGQGNGDGQGDSQGDGDTTASSVAIPGAVDAHESEADELNDAQRQGPQSDSADASSERLPASSERLPASSERAPDADREPGDAPDADLSSGDATGPALAFVPDIELLGAYRLQVRDTEAGRETFHTFALDRALVSLGVEYGDAHGNLMLEAVPGSDEGALLAVAGDSTVMRVREAWGGYNIRGWVDVQAGIVRTLTQPMLEGLERMRPIGRGPHERFNVLFPADVGLTVDARLPAGYGRVAVGVYNGESYRSRERNRGKNTEYLLELHPLAALESVAPLRIFASYVLGSEGAASARSNRLTVGLAWASDWLRAGADLSLLRGYRGNGSQDGRLSHAYVSARIDQRWLVGLRGVHFARNLDESEDRILGFEAMLGAVIAGPLEAYLSFGRDSLGDTARAALPGLQAWQVQAVVRVAAQGTLATSRQANDRDAESAHESSDAGIAHEAHSGRVLEGDASEASVFVQPSGDPQ